MDPSKGPSLPKSFPVEMDESMTPSSLDLAFRQCIRQAESSRRPQEHAYEEPRGEARGDVGPWKPLESQYEPRGQMKPLHPADVWPRGYTKPLLLHQQDLMIDHAVSPVSYPHHSVEAESLERPLSLVSDANGIPAARLPGYGPTQGGLHRQCTCCPHYRYDRPHEYPHQEPQHQQQLQHQQLQLQQQLQHQQQQQWPSRNHYSNRPQLADARNASHGSVPRCEVAVRGVAHEVSVQPSLQPGPKPATTEIKKTISLPAECRTVFITYSVDTAKEMLFFAKFLTDQGFNPQIDIFDNAIQRMDIIKWMDRFLNDKSVLIIVVISPKYKKDVDGHGDDEHGLHTKYIHNQIQKEYIQQGCMNFRLVPVLFPNATKEDHVPNWLKSTRIYRWPHQSQDLLLRLLREERYIIPQPACDPTITLRPI